MAPRRCFSHGWLRPTAWHLGRSEEMSYASERRSDAPLAGSEPRDSIEGTATSAVLRRILANKESRVRKRSGIERPIRCRSKAISMPGLPIAANGLGGVHGFRKRL